MKLVPRDPAVDWLTVHLPTLRSPAVRKRRLLAFYDRGFIDGDTCARLYADHHLEAA